MGKNCCEQGIHLLHRHPGPAGADDRQRRPLWLVFWINVAMSVVEGAGGWQAGSQSVLADSIHLLGHVFIVGLSLFALSRGSRWKAGAALLNGLINIALGAAVLAEALSTLYRPSELPSSGLMSAIGLFSGLANLACLVLLARHRHDDINMRAAWLCSRNDLLTNAGVVVTSMGVALWRSHWPDTVVAILLAAAVLGSSIRISRQAWRLLRRPLEFRPVVAKT